MITALPKVMSDDAVTLKYGARWIQSYLRISQRGLYDNVVTRSAFLIVERAGKMKNDAKPLIPSLISVYSLPDYKHKDLYLAVTRPLVRLAPLLLQLCHISINCSTAICKASAMPLVWRLKSQSNRSMRSIKSNLALIAYRRLLQGTQPSRSSLPPELASRRSSS